MTNQHLDQTTGRSDIERLVDQAISAARDETIIATSSRELIVSAGGNRALLAAARDAATGLAARSDLAAFATAARSFDAACALVADHPDGRMSALRRMDSSSRTG